MVEGSGPVLTFDVMSDTHITTDQSRAYNMRFRNALIDYGEVEPGAAALCVVGDLTDTGAQTAWDNLMSILNALPHPAPYLVLGNHDVRWQSGGYAAALALYRTKTGMPGAYWDAWISGYHFIFLAGEQDAQDMAFLSDTQLSWLKAKLAERANPAGPRSCSCISLWPERSP